MSEYIEFLERIKTYSFDKWTLRSSKISPYHLASWGFNCIEEDTFQCCMCQQTISAAHLPFQSEAEEENTIDVDLLIKNFYQSISCIHKEECLYNENTHNSSVFFTLNEEFFSSNMEQLYNLVYNSYEYLDEKKDLPQIPDENESSYYPQLDISFLKIIVRKTLAAFAWRYDEDTQTRQRILSCDYCGRSVHLKNYPKAASRYMKLEQQVSTEGFNPLEEHKYFCKWSSAQVYSNDILLHEDQNRSSSKEESSTKQKSDKLAHRQINGWNICINYLLDQFTFQSKKKKTYETVSEIHKMQDEIKKQQADFKSFEAIISDKHNQIMKECQSMNLNSIDSSSSFKQKLQSNRQSIDDILKDLNLNSLLADPSKKIKTN